MDKKISYLARDFEAVRGELDSFAQKYYPELATEYNDASVGSFLMDLAASVGDELAYHTDRVFQETQLDSANTKSALLNIARAAGVKIPGKKASMCEVKISCVLPVTYNNTISAPNWNCAPFIKMGTIVTAGNISFELAEDVNFAEQFNKDAYSNRTFEPQKDANGRITGYKVSKTVMASNGITRIYKKTLTNSMVKPFMEVILPETNVMSVDSIIFKTTSSYNISPEPYEYFVPSESYKFHKEDSIETKRFFEVDSLVDLYKFGCEPNYVSGTTVDDIYNPEMYKDYIVNNNGIIGTHRIYQGAWMPLRQKFITEYTDNGYMKIIFGSGNNYTKNTTMQNTKFADRQMCNIINNDMLGILPEIGWTMFIRYTVGGGSSTNIAPGAINGIALGNVSFKNNGLSDDEKSRVRNSIEITNISNAIAGKDEPSEEEIKYIIKYNTNAQNRCVTVKDYKVKLMQMPPKFGAPFRSQVIETNNKIEMDLLGLDASGKLDSFLPDQLIKNIINYMEHYKSINDYIEIRSGKVYNIGFAIDVFIDKNYTTANVVSNIINTVRDYFDVNRHDMGDDIFMGDLEKEITLLDGVMSLINVSAYRLYGGKYSGDKCPLPLLSDDGGCNKRTQSFNKPDGAIADEIDLNSIDRVLYSDYNSMFEILDPNNDIQIRVKLK